ncbi:XRE family transcriptional regulator [Marivirga sp.]|uniref:XRE family transcriptional regulator n=1 Tax=Marivirga sp. TaxID=2018662 RepID=UPI0025ECEEA8|nr:XRE family transcriptional regulator [Marivirga sp.]
MTRLGTFLSKESINKAEVSKRTGISTSSLSELTLNSSTQQRAHEVYLNAIAKDVSPCEVLEADCDHLTLQN